MLKRFFHGAAILSARRFIKLTGLDAPKFLQGLTTNDIQKLSDAGQYSALLNAQGRMMYDIFIYRADEDYFVECDGQIQERVFLHLQTYNLRTKTDIKMIDGPVVVFSSIPLEGAAASAKDVRSNWNFTRYLFHSKPIMETLIAKVPTFTEGQYNRERILRGIPEGAYEIASRQSIPLEYNVDLMGGIDFNKGCYLGQELVTRTHHRGVVRKRVLPLRFLLLDPETVQPLRSTEPFECDPHTTLTKNLDKQNEFLPTSIEPSGKLKILSRTDSVGKHIFSQGNIGIGMMRLDALKDAESRKNLATLDHIDSNWVLADSLIPEWWPQTIFDNL